MAPLSDNLPTSRGWSASTSKDIRTGWRGPLPPITMILRPSSIPQRRRLRYLAVAVLVALFLWCWTGSEAAVGPGGAANWSAQRKQQQYQRPMGKGPQYQSSSQTNAAALTTGDHPIDALIQAAEKEFSAKLQEQSLSLAEAAAVYRERRGRHPPPGFRQWYEFAAVHKAVVVEEFWDQIYADLEPLWSVRPGRLRRDAADFEMRITVRTGKASTTSEWFWTQIWLSMIQSIEHLLPDMDLALNAMDEPRIVVPWEKMRDHMAQAAKTKKLPDDVESVVSVFQRLPPPGQEQPEPKEKSRDLKWEGTSMLFPAKPLPCPQYSRPVTQSS